MKSLSPVMVVKRSVAISLLALFMTSAAAQAALPNITVSDFDSSKRVTLQGAGNGIRTINGIVYNLKLYRSTGNPFLDVELYSRKNIAAFKEEYRGSGATRKKVLRTDYDLTNRSVARPIKHTVYAENQTSVLFQIDYTYARSGAVSSAFRYQNGTKALSLPFNVSLDMARTHLANEASASAAISYVRARISGATDYLIAGASPANEGEMRYLLRSSAASVLIEQSIVDSTRIYRPIQLITPAGVDLLPRVFDQLSNFAGKASGPKNVTDFSYRNGTLTVDTELLEKGLVRSVTNAAGVTTFSYLRAAIDDNKARSYVAQRIGVTDVGNLFVNGFAQPMGPGVPVYRLTYSSNGISVTVNLDQSAQAIRKITLADVKTSSGESLLNNALIGVKSFANSPAATVRNVTRWSLNNGILSVDTDLGSDFGLVRTTLNTATMQRNYEYIRQPLPGINEFLDIFSSQKGPGAFDDFVLRSRALIENLTGQDTVLTKIVPGTTRSGLPISDSIFIRLESAGYEWRIISDGESGATNDSGQTPVATDLLGIVKIGQPNGVDFLDNAFLLVYPDTPKDNFFAKKILESKIKVTSFSPESGFDFELLNAQSQRVQVRVGITGQASLANTLNVNVLTLDSDIVRQSTVQNAPVTGSSMTQPQAVMAEIASRNDTRVQAQGSDPRMVPVMLTENNQDRNTNN